MAVRENNHADGQNGCNGVRFPAAHLLNRNIMSKSRSSCRKPSISQNDQEIKPEPKHDGRWYKVNRYTQIFIKKGQDPELMIGKYRDKMNEL